MPATSITCQKAGCSHVVNDPGALSRLFASLQRTYVASTAAGDDAAQYWADIAVNSKHPLAPLAHVPGVFAALWTPEVAPTTAITLATAGYGFAALPRHLTHFTTVAGARGIAASGIINSARFGLGGIFGPGVYMARVGLPLNGFIKATATVPILLATPAGTVRIVAYLVYVRWGFAGVKVRL